MKYAVDKISAANDAISNARLNLTQAIQRMLDNKTHTFKTYDVYVTDEEEGTRNQVKSVNKDEVTFHDGSTMEFGNMGTDDIHSVADMLCAELTENK
jgi:hypothetical protein